MATGRMYTGAPDAAKGHKPLGEYDHDYSADEVGAGWLSFAGAVMLILGSLNVVYGIAAIDNAQFFVNDAKYVFGDLNTWGWFLVVVGAVQFCAAFGIFAGNRLARWIGIVTAVGNAILQLLFLPAYPWLSLTLFAADVFVLYALIAFGGQSASTPR
jgi:hypothetical protein